MLYVLAALSFLLAISQYLFGAAPFGDTAASDVLGSLFYAFAPLILALVLVGLKHLVQRRRGQPTSFATDLVWVWGFFLAVVFIAHVVAMVQA